MSKIVVLHTGYGCETGCCGHVIEVDDKQQGGFHFSHPWSAKTPEEFRSWTEQLIIEELGPEHVKDLDWEHCVIAND